MDTEEREDILWNFLGGMNRDGGKGELVSGGDKGMFLGVACLLLIGKGEEQVKVTETVWTEYGRQEQRNGGMDW